MYNRPIFYIVARLLRPIVRLIGMPSNLTPIYHLLWNSTSGLISAVGVGNTMRVLLRLNNQLRFGGSNPINLDPILIGRLGSNPLIRNIINEQFIRVLTPHVPAIVQHRSIFIKILYLIMMTVFTFVFRPLVAFALRSIFSVIFSTTCILWSETLRGIKILFEYALAIREVLSPYISIPIPNGVKIQISKVSDVLQSDIATKVKSVCLTGIILIISLAGIDMISPYHFEQLPYVGWFISQTYFYLLIPAARELRTSFDFIGFNPLTYIFRIFRG